MSAPAQIFISIAAYREFDLVNTVRDALGTATHPAGLRFCICWQHAPGEHLEGLETHPQVEIIDVAHTESRGVCWARHAIQQRYQGETYSLQIDGHHRFVPEWDRLLIEMLEGLKAGGVEKPVLTGYLPSFDPFNDPAARDGKLWLYGFDRFEPSGVVFMKPYTPEQPPDAPVPCRFWSAHFSFSDGRFNREVPIDPHGYFHAEEIGTAVRAWTSGFDFFTPHRTVAWHEYTRKGRICHWNDHSDWGQRNARAIARYRHLFGIDGVPRRDFGAYGFGTVRSLGDYERWAGVCFANRGVEPEVLTHTPPPSTHLDLDRSTWESSLVRSHSIDLYLDRVLLASEDPTHFVALFAHDLHGGEIHRRDLSGSPLQDLLAGQQGQTLHVPLAFFSTSVPVRWTAWAGSGTHGWKQRVDGDWPPPSGPAMEDTYAQAG